MINLPALQPRHVGHQHLPVEARTSFEVWQMTLRSAAAPRKILHAPLKLQNSVIHPAALTWTWLIEPDLREHHQY